MHILKEKHIAGCYLTSYNIYNQLNSNNYFMLYRDLQLIVLSIIHFEILELNIFRKLFEEGEICCYLNSFCYNDDAYLRGYG